MPSPHSPWSFSASTQHSAWWPHKFGDHAHDREPPPPLPFFMTVALLAIALVAAINFFQLLTTLL